MNKEYRQGRVNTCVLLDEPIWEQLTEQAETLNLTLQDLLTEIIISYLGHEQQDMTEGEASE